MSGKKKINQNGFALGVDVVKTILNNAQRTKEGVSRYLENIDPQKMIDYLVKNYDIELVTKVSFKKKDKLKKK